MTKTVKTASFRTFEAAKLAAGKYAGMCISRSEEREHEGKFFAHYSSGARNVSRDWYGVMASDVAAIGYECLGFWDIPAGLKAAALMVCRISDYSRNFRFSLDRSGAWSFHYYNAEGFEYSNGSAEDVRGDRVEMDDDQNAKEFVWALSRFGRVQLWKKGGRIFMAVGSIDDGRLLLLNDGVNARFVNAEDDVWTPDPVAEVVAAVASYPTAPAAACEAPRTGDNYESAENTDNAKNGVRIEKNAEFGSVEIYFKEKPSQVVREALKTARFRWHGVKKCWYGKPENAKNVMTTSSEARAVLLAISGAFKAVNVASGTGTPLNTKTAPEAKETAKAEAVPEPVEGKRDFLRDIRKGDVVRISGVKGATGKSINGLYYVETVHGAGDYWLNSLKRDRGSDFEGIGKKSHSWPLHCYANNPKVRAEFRENIKDAKIEGMGPRSAAVYSLMLRNLDDLRKSLDEGRIYGGECYRQEMQKRSDELEAELGRMRDENPGLDRFAAKLDEKFKPTGPGLAIRSDGLEVRTDCGTWDKYNLTLRHVEDSVFISGSYYGHRSSTIPAGFGFDVTNDSDSMTDYFEADKATVKQDHPLFDTLVRIIDAGRGRYELTDADAEAIAAHLKAKETAAEAAREAERAEYIEKCKKQEQHAREVIDEYVELFPGDAYHPHIIVEWSELGVMDDHGRERGDATIFSVEAFEAITGELDAYFRDDQGYYKLKFEFVDPVHGDHHFVDRCDIGEGTGSYGSRARMVIKWCKEHPNQEYMRDGGATCTPAEGTTDAYYYLENIPATFDEINAA